MEPQTTKKRFLRMTSAMLALAVLAGGVALYRYKEGRLELHGRVQTRYTVVPAASGGRVSDVAVVAGAPVTRGQVLVRLDEEARRTALVQAQEQLTLLAQMLPTQYRPAPESGGESLDQRHERLQGEEEAATRHLQEATDREAEASVLYSRIAMMAARGKATGDDRAAAERYLAEVRRQKERAKHESEAASLSRATSGADIRRIKDAQRASGAADLPADIRVDRYRQQEERVSIAMRALEQSLLCSPVDGVVTEVLAIPGREVKPGAPLVVLRQEGAPLSVSARASADERKEIKPGMRCFVRVTGEDTNFDGYVSDLRPDQAGNEAAAYRVSVSLLPGGPLPPAAAHTANAEDFDAAVTVLLREPLYVTALDGDGQPGAAVAEPAPMPPGQGAPPALPLRIQTPSGSQAPPHDGDGAPSDASRQDEPEAGSEKTGRGAPALRPMQAPYPLKGSPLPDPGNNPSVVTKDILDNAAAAPR